MKKRTILIISTVMGVSFLALLFMQLRYIEEMVKMKKEQFDESVKKALYQASRNLELNETLRFLEKNLNGQDLCSTADTLDANDERGNKDSHHEMLAGKSTVYPSFELRTNAVNPANVSKAIIMRNDKGVISETTKSMHEIVKNRYVYQKALLEEVVYSILYTASEKPLKERVNFKQLDRDLKSELVNNGISLPYHFKVSTLDGREVYRCPDYTDVGEEYSYSQLLFRNDPQNKKGVISIHFPDMSSYIFSSVRFMIPSVAFTLVLLVTFLFTLVIVFRQKKLTEIKNDFINNMTHELKTPISSMSLAAQMLNDDSITKSAAMIKHLGGVINDESKRLRFLVEKVLQMSMVDKKTVSFKKKELDINEMVESISHTFTLRVEHTGGRINLGLKAKESLVYVDEVHFTNVIFNLIDNAIKYGKPDQPLDLWINTWNDKDKLYVSIKDNGIGIKKEDQKKIFDKFFRVHTGNVHDVKGFGLGLSYVKRIVELHKGVIHVDSDKGKGTKFTISLPLIKTQNYG